MLSIKMIEILGNLHTNDRINITKLNKNINSTYSHVTKIVKILQKQRIIKIEKGKRENVIVLLNKELGQHAYFLLNVLKK